MDPLFEKKMQELVELAKSSMTREELLAAFQKIVESIRKLELNMIGKVDTRLSDTISELQMKHEMSSSEMKKEMDSKCSQEFNRLNDLITKKLAEIRDGVDGKDADVSETAKEAVKMVLEELENVIPTIEDIEKDLPKLGDRIRDSLELLQGDERLDITAIKGIEERLEAIQKGIKNSLGGGGFNPIYSDVNKLLCLLSPDNSTATGLIINMPYGESITLGDLLFFKSDGKVYQADMTSIATGKIPCLGLALETASSGTNKVLLQGTYKDTTKWTGGTALTVGGVVYLSTTGGATQTAPSATDQVVQVIGIAVAANTIYFNPSPDYITRV